MVQSFGCVIHQIHQNLLLQNIHSSVEIIHSNFHSFIAVQCLFQFDIKQRNSLPCQKCTRHGRLLHHWFQKKEENIFYGKWRPSLLRNVAHIRWGWKLEIFCQFLAGKVRHWQRGVRLQCCLFCISFYGNIYISWQMPFCGDHLMGRRCDWLRAERLELTKEIVFEIWKSFLKLLWNVTTGLEPKTFLILWTRPWLTDTCVVTQVLAEETGWNLPIVHIFAQAMLRKQFLLLVKVRIIACWPIWRKNNFS